MIWKMTAITALSLMSPINIGYQSSTFPYNVRTSLLCQFTVRMYLVFTLLLVFPFSLNVIVKKGTDARLKCVVSCKSISLSIIKTYLRDFFLSRCLYFLHIKLYFEWHVSTLRPYQTLILKYFNIVKVKTKPEI